MSTIGLQCSVSFSIIPAPRGAGYTGLYKPASTSTSTRTSQPPFWRDSAVLGRQCISNTIYDNVIIMIQQCPASDPAPAVLRPSISMGRTARRQHGPDRPSARSVREYSGDIKLCINDFYG